MFLGPAVTAATMTKAAFARHRGVGRNAVSNWIKRDQIVVTPDGKVHVAASEEKLARLVDPNGGRPPTGTPDAGAVTKLPMAAPTDLASVRARELHERSINQALKNAQLAGKLVPIAAYEARLQAEISGFCDRMASELRNVAERLALETDQRVIRSILGDVVHGVRASAAEKLGEA